MRLSLARGALGIIASAALFSCSEAPIAPISQIPTPQRSVVLPSVRFSEIHYDNPGTDGGESIEVSGPAGTDVTGWRIFLYNGSNGLAYDSSKIMSGAFPATCDDRGVMVFTYAVNGIQNGDPDGLALVDASRNVIEFLSYEGTFTALNGPANGLASVDIGVREAGATPEPGVAPFWSLKRDGSGVWSGPSLNNFGVCNDDEEPPPPPEVASVQVAPATATVFTGGTQQFTATAYDASNQPIANVTFTWSSSAPAVASVSASGLATGLQAGDANIIAEAPNGVTGTAALHVEDAPPPPGGNPRINEIHYDNTSTDAGEAIEIEGPAGLNLSGWSLVLYNGNGGASYNTQSLSGVISATCGERGVVVINYAVNGIQNGAPDGIALVGPSGVVEFLSYEGTFTAVGGAANGLTSTDIGVHENPDNSVPTGLSLQRKDDGAWYGPHTSTLGACNAPPPPIVINELMADPRNAAGGASWGEWFEVHNHGANAIDLQGWTISSSGQPSHVVGASVVVPAGGFAVLGRGADMTQNGGVALDYNYFSGSGTATIFLDPTDVLELRDGAGVLVDRVRWTNSATMVQGITRALRDATIENHDVDGGNWGYSTVPFGDGDFGTPGAANGTLNSTPPKRVTFSGRFASDPSLPVNFEDQLFATLEDGGVAVPTTFTWESLTPGIASIDADGVIRGIAAGSATFRATAADGTVGTHTLPVAVATASATALYGNHTEFGDPVDGDASDDFIIRRGQLTTSFNNARGIPNWVSFNLDATHFGPQDRCDCFTFDPELETAGFQRYNTATYTGLGGQTPFHGYPIDRGHLVRSFDRTAGTLDNAVTYYFSNIIPQAADNNQGPWAAAEAYLGDFARIQNKEVYIIAGASGSKGTVKDEGRITIPSQVWKVAVILPRDQGLAHIDDYQDLEVIALIMPNDPGIRNVDWNSYRTTVDAVEALSGYDVLSLLPDKIEIAVESQTHPPVAATDGPYAGSLPGEAVAMSGAASSDADSDALSFSWSFGDGTTGSGVTTSHTYTAAGVYTVQLIVTDIRGIADTATTTATVLSPLQAVSNAITMVDQMVADGILSAHAGNSIKGELNTAKKHLERNRPGSALGSLQNVLDQINGLVRSNRLSDAEAEPLRTLVTRIIDAIS